MTGTKASCPMYYREACFLDIFTGHLSDRQHHTLYVSMFHFLHKFLHTGFPRYFAPYLSSYSRFYSTRRSQRGGNFLVIPIFHLSVHKSVKQFGNSFAFDASSIWNALPDEIRASPSRASFRKQLKTYLYTKAYPP